MQSMKIINVAIVAMMLLISGVLGAELLPIHLNYHRFLDSEGKTLVLVDYQVVYRNLSFLAQSGGFFAQLEVELSAAANDSTFFTHKITDNIGISNKYDASSGYKKYLNRIAFQYDQPLIRVSFKAKDPNSKQEFRWEKELQALKPESRISDVELNARVYADSSSFTQKFQRGGKVHEPLPAIIVNKSNQDHLYLYAELYCPPQELGSSYLLNLSLENAGEFVMDEYFDVNIEKSTQAFTLKIPLSDLAPGKYQGNMDLQSELDLEHRSFEFVLTEDIEQRFQVFNDLEDEYALIRYFLASKSPSDWAKMNDAAKERYINQFWRNMALSARMSEEDMIRLVDERVRYANQHFSSLRAGWLSDMGRIYVRNGAPSDTEKGSTQDDTRFVRKDFEVWKYSNKGGAVYLFLDIQMNNNYRLIHSKNDELEHSNPDWQRYVGESFDSNLLRN